MPLPVRLYPSKAQADEDGEQDGQDEAGEGAAKEKNEEEDDDDGEEEEEEEEQQQQGNPGRTKKSSLQTVKKSLSSCLRW